MIVFHVTPAGNQASIEEHGILRKHATSSLRRIWLVDFERLNWAAEHVRKRHGVDDVVAFKAYVRTCRLRKWRDGVYFTEIDVLWTTCPLITVYPV